MTSSWQVVEGIGIGVQVSYLVLLFAALWQSRRNLRRMRFRWVTPIVIGNFVALSVPWVFESVVVSRACFISALIIYLGGMALVARDLARRDAVETSSVVNAS